MNKPTLILLALLTVTVLLTAFSSQEQATRISSGKIYLRTLKQKSDGSSYNKIIAKNIVVRGGSVEFTLVNGASKIPGGRVGKKYVVTEGVWIYPDQ